jgi:hypothetical protein
MVAAAFVRLKAASPPLTVLPGTVAPATRSLVVVDVGNGLGSGGMAAPAARDLVVVIPASSASSLRASTSHPAFSRGPISPWVLAADAANGWAWQWCSSPSPSLPRRRPLEDEIVLALIPA